MTGAIWVIGESKGQGVARVSAEAATLARSLGCVSARDVVGVITGATPESGARDLATYVPRVLAVQVPEAAGHAYAAAVAPVLAALVNSERPRYLLMGATPDGRDLAGMLSALLGWGVLVNAGGVEWSGGAPSVEMSVFGGRIITTSTFTDEHGIITLRPNSVAAEPAGAAGEVESVTVSRSPALPLVAIRERTSETSSEVPVEEASVIVAGGRGIGGPEGLSLVQELAHALGGAVGATRPAVDSGWIPYGQQIGQTGKTVKPKLYVALGISGATQHIVGILGAETILSINRDREAPITELSDLAIIGDLFQVGPAILHALRARTS